MSNQYFDWTSSPDRFVFSDTVRSADANKAFDQVSAGLDKLPTPATLASGSANYAGIDTGAANAYVVTASTQVVSYFDGLTIRFKAANENTGNSTVNVNALGLKVIGRPDGSNINPADIKAGQIVEIVYSSTSGKFQLQNSGAAQDAAQAQASAIAAAASASAASGSASAAASSAASASSSAGTATTQAGIATTQAGIATTQATAASGYAAALQGTSSTSVAIGSGSKSFTTQANRAFAVGMWLIAVGSGAPSNYMVGQVTAYNAGTGALTISVPSNGVAGSGTRTDWNIAMSGPPGPIGATGADGMSIVSTQRGTIALNSAATTNTATITAVNPAKTQLRFLGMSSSALSDDSGQARIALTNSTTITASRISGSNGDITLSWELTEFS